MGWHWITAIAPSNPFKSVKVFKENVTEENGKIHIFTTDETSRLLNAADPRVIPFLALWFFCGIRRATLERLKWTDFQFEESRVVVPGFAGKLQRRYPVTLSENLLAWLRPFMTLEGSILALDRSGKPNAISTRKLILKAAKKAGLSLPGNVGRHTFISMHAEFHQNLPLTAKEANNSVEIIEQTYLHLVSRADAQRYWTIVPPGTT